MGGIKSKPELPREDLDFLKAHTCYDEDTIKEWYEGFKKDCANGRLTPDKFVNMYKMLSPSGNVEQFCDHVFRAFDTDKNGYVDFKEFLLALDICSNGTAEKKLKWAYKLYDVDGDGVINREEMTKIVQSIYEMMDASATRPTDSAKEKTMDIFSRMDENGDGHLTEDEFISGCLHDEEISKMLAPNVSQ